jgi:hypothetical protein
MGTRGLRGVGIRGFSGGLARWSGADYRGSPGVGLSGCAEGRPISSVHRMMYFRRSKHMSVIRAARDEEDRGEC